MPAQKIGKRYAIEKKAKLACGLLNKAVIAQSLSPLAVHLAKPDFVGCIAGTMH
jgi:hypothetical protein